VRASDGYGRFVTSISGFTTRPEMAGTKGMVAASHWLAAQAGMTMLEQGGNAFDAAVAAGFVLHVVEPHQCGPGGEAPMVVYSVLDDEYHVIDGQGPAPAAATIAAFRELGLELVPGSGLLAACVPAALGSWLLLLERFGTMRLQEVLSPAIGYARDGFPGHGSLTFVLRAIEPFVRASWPTTAELWLGGDRLPRPGDRLTNRLLAEFYERLLREAAAVGDNREAQIEAARRAIYEGFVAEIVDAFVRQPVRDEAGVHSGVITAEDFAGWRPGLERPTRFRYKEFEVLKTGPWGQGPVFLQQLALLANFEVASLAPCSEELVHLVTECAKLAFADREAFYGDPRHVDVPLETLLSKEYNAERAKLISETADDSFRPGTPAGRMPAIPRYAVTDPAAAADEGAFAALGQSAVPGGDPSRAGRERAATGEATSRRDTCHVDVVDAAGNFVSATPSGGWLQSSPAVPGLGFCLGTRAQMFWLEEGLASSLGPGRRPRTTLSPTLALREGQPYLAFGTPGGDQQDQWTLRFFLYHAEFGYDLQAAIDAANWHSTHFPSSFHPRDARPGEVVVEENLGEDVMAALRRRGHVVSRTPPWSIGRVTAVSKGRDGILRGGADPRNQQAYVAGR
jgi:gamma-glutamyltranspeptidase/glutathione hydrolase